MGTTEGPDDARRLAHHRGRVRLEHLDSTHAAHSPKQDGATAWWADGTTSYVLHTRSGHVHGWTIADETDTAIQAVDRLRAGEEIPADGLWTAFQHVRRLRTRLEALESELILYAREKGADGRPRMPLREIAEGVGTHHTTVAERHARMIDGELPAWRHWLVQGTPRDEMYAPAGAQTLTGRRVEGDCSVCGGPLLSGLVKATPGGGWAHEDCHGRQDQEQEGGR